MKLRLKSWIPALALFVLAGFYLAGCGSKKSTTVAIPANAQFVIAANPASLFQKASFEEISKLYTYTFVSSQMEDAGEKDRRAFDFINNLMKDPEQTGIDLKQNLYFFTVVHQEEGDKFSYMGMTGNLKDASKLESLLKDALKITDIKEEDGLKSVTISNDMALVWNDGTVLALVSDSYRKRDQVLPTAISYLKLEKDKTLGENKDFAKFVSTVEDMGMWATPGDFATEVLPKRELEQVGLTEADLHDNYLHTLFMFKEGEVNWKTDIVWSPGVKKAFKSMAGKNIGTDIFKYVPAEKLVGFFGFSLNMENIVANLRDMAKKNKQLGQGLPMAEMMLSMQGLSLDKLSTLLTGKVFVAVTDLAIETKQYGTYESSEPKPSIMFALGVSDSKEVQEHIEKMAGEMVPIRKEGNLYRVKMGMPGYEEVWYTYVDGYMLLATEKLHIENASKGALPADKQVSKEVAKLANGPLTAYLNMDSKRMPKDLAKNAQVRLALEQLKVDYLGLDNNDEYVRMTAKLKDSKANSLMSVLKLADVALMLDEASRQTAKADMGADMEAAEIPEGALEFDDSEKY